MPYPFVNLTPRYARNKKQFKLPSEASLRLMPPSVAGSLNGGPKMLMPGYIPLDPEDPEGHLEAARKLRREVVKERSKEASEEVTRKTYKVPGKDYVVSEVNGVWSCTCKGFQFRRKCRHIEEIKECLK